MVRPSPVDVPIVTQEHLNWLLISTWKGLQLFNISSSQCNCQNPARLTLSVVCDASPRVISAGGGVVVGLTGVAGGGGGAALPGNVNGAACVWKTRLRDVRTLLS